MEINSQIGDKNGIANSLNNIGKILMNQVISYVLEAYKISENLHSPSEQIQNILTSIKNALGEEKYRKLVSDANL